MLQDEILAMLEQSRDALVTGGQIARRLGISRTAVWKAVITLRETGNDIESVQGRGYRLLMGSDGLSEAAVRLHLQTEALGRRMEIHRIVDSTNTYLKRLDTTALPEGYTVLADEQSGGRGRMNRTFHSPPRSGVYMSVLLKPPVTLAETPFLTICAAVAVCETLREDYGANAGIKWVNDVYCGGKKICGILTEAAVTAEMQSVDYAVAGIGINTGDVADEVGGIATSLLLETGRPALRAKLAAQVLNRFEQVYRDYIFHGKKTQILTRYTDMLFILGMRVEVEEGGHVYEAVARGVNENGALLVETADRKTRTLSMGEVRLKPIAGSHE